MTDRAELVKQADAARALGISRQAVGVWMTKPGAPLKRVKGVAHCLWPDFVLWHRERLLEAEREKAKPASVEEAKLRKETAEAELKELELAERRGELMTVDDAARTLNESYGRVASKLKHLARAVALRVTADTIPAREAQAQPLVDEILAELERGDGEDDASD